MASLNSSHSRSSLGSQDSINGNNPATPAQGGTVITHPNQQPPGTSNPFATKSVIPVPVPLAPAQLPHQIQQHQTHQLSQQHSPPGPPEAPQYAQPVLAQPPPPPALPQAPPLPQPFTQYPPQPPQASQFYAQPSQFPPPPLPNFPQANSGYAPPPAPNYLPPPDNQYSAGNMSARPLPPVPMYNDNFELVSPSMSVSPSQVSISSHQSSESSRSLSPPIGPKSSPGQSRSQFGTQQLGSQQLVSVHEEASTSLQQALVNQLTVRHRDRSHSNEAEAPHNIPRTTSLGSRGAPPVAHKPPRAPAHKPPVRSQTISAGIGMRKFVLFAMLLLSGARFHTCICAYMQTHTHTHTHSSLSTQWSSIPTPPPAVLRTPSPHSEPSLQ